MISLTTKEDFEMWLFDMSTTLEEFISGFPVEVGRQLDFSPESLKLVEKLILEKYSSIAEMLQPNQSVFVNGLACYIGQAFRKSIGGEWYINLDNPEDAFFGLPTLRNSPLLRAPLCPHTLASATADRRTGNYLYGIYKNLKK